MPKTDAATGPQADLLPLARPGSQVVLAGTWSQLEGSELLPVPSVRSSVLDLESVLRDRVGVPQQNLRLVRDPHSPLELGSAIAESAAAATDSLVVYYAGHGLVGPDGGLYLATRSTENLMDGLRYTALPYAALRESVIGSRARAVAVILDCCFSGRPPGPLGSMPLAPVFEQAAVRGGYLLAGTAREERGLAVPGATHTAFTGALIRLLIEGDQSFPELLTLDHAYRYLAGVLPEEGAPRPHRQASDEAGDLVLAPNRAYRPPPGPVKDPPLDGPCPYRGLDAFSPADSRYFFGRERLARDLVDRVNSCRGMIAVVGASGCGKTSLLRAGVVPELELQGWKAAYLKPGPDPTAALEKGVTALAAEEHQVVLLVDQFEELFTSDVTEDERQRFVTDLAKTADGGTPVIIAIRSDFYQMCIQYVSLAQVLEDRQVIVTPMASQELKSAIEKPAEKAGLYLEEGLARTLLNEARVRRDGEQSAVLPFLQYALLATWQRRSGSTLTLAGYEAAGRIDGAVEHAAREAWKQMLAAGIAEEQIRTVLMRLVRLGEGTEDTRRRVTVAELARGDEVGSVRRLLDILTRARLVTVDDDSAELAHEALLYAWPQLRGWIKDDRDALLAVQRVSDAARSWDQAGRKDEDLYPGTRLRTVFQVARLAPVTKAAGDQQPDPVLDPVARDFLDASQRASRRRSRRRWAGLAMVCVLVLAAAVAGAYSVREQQDAAQHTATVDSTQLAADAQSLRATDPGLAAQLAIAAYRYAPTEQAATEMYDSLSTPLDNVVGTDGSYVRRVAAEADGPLAAAIAQDGTLRVWNMSDTSASALDATIRSGVAAIALSSRDRLLAGACADRGVCLWSLANPRHPVLAGRWRMPSGAKMGFTSMSISPDGKLLAAASKYGFTLVWSIADPSGPRLIADLPNPTSRDDGTLAAVAFAPRGHILAETIAGGVTRLWSIADPARLVLLATIKAGYSSIAFDPASSLLAAVGDTNIGIWQIEDPRHPERLQVDEQDVSDEDLVAAAFSPDGDDLAFTGLDTNDALAQVCTLRIPDVLLDPGTGPVCTTTGFQSQTAAYTASGSLLTGGPGGLRLWRWPEHLAEGDLVGGGGPGQISPDGRLMATGVASSPDQVDIWGLGGLATPFLDAAIPVAHVGLVEFVSPRVLLIADGKGRTRLWDLRDPRHPVPAASLGTAGTQSAGTIGAESANRLAGIQGPDGQLNLWRITSATDAVQVGSIPGAPVPAGIDPDSQTAFQVTGNKIQWWDISNPAHPVRQGTSVLPGSGGLDTAITAGNLLVATTTIDSGSSLALNTSNLVLFDVAQGRVRSTATLSTTAGAELEVSPDHHLLAVASGGGGAVTLWDISDPRHPRSLSTVPAQLDVQGIEFSPDSKVLAVSSQGTVQLWDIHNPQEPAPVGSITSLLGGDTGGNSGFGTVDNPVFGLAFTGQSDTLAISADTTTSLFDSDPAQVAAQLCGYTGVPISPAQWQQDAPDVPYRRPCP